MPSHVAAGGEPLRCCLRISPEGDEIALISYQPSAQGGPYAEIGPVFVHATDCGGPAAGFPADLVSRQAVLRLFGDPRPSRSCTTAT